MQLKEGVRIELKHVTKAYGDKPVLKRAEPWGRGRRNARRDR